MSVGIVKSYSFPEGNIRGDTFYIKHISDNFTVIDCYLKEGEDKSCRKREIINEVIKESGGRLTRFISTHPDDDHIMGIEALDNEWPIVNFYAVKNDIPSDDKKVFRTWYLRRLENGDFFDIQRGLCKKWLNQSDAERGSSGLSFMWPQQDDKSFQDALSVVKGGGSPNNISCVIKYSIEFGPSYLWMGDMETDMQRKFFDVCGEKLSSVDVLFHPHHGRYSSKLPEELFKKLDPQIIVVGNAPSEYLNYSCPERTLTQNTTGDIVFANDGGWIDVFLTNRIDSKPICLKHRDGHVEMSGGLYIGSVKARKSNTL